MRKWQRRKARLWKKGLGNPGSSLAEGSSGVLVGPVEA